MILRSSRLKEETIITEGKDGITMQKIVNLEPVLANNYLQKKELNNGFTKDRSMRKIASIPFETWLNLTQRFPELLLGDKELKEKTLNKWLHSEEGKMFWSVEKGV